MLLLTWVMDLLVYSLQFTWWGVKPYPESQHEFSKKKYQPNITFSWTYWTLKQLLHRPMKVVKICNNSFLIGFFLKFLVVSSFLTEISLPQRNSKVVFQSRHYKIKEENLYFMFVNQTWIITALKLSHNFSKFKQNQCIAVLIIRAKIMWLMNWKYMRKREISPKQRQMMRNSFLIF